jgi:hypothetical protein
MSNTASQIVQAALQAKTAEEAADLQSSIAMALGGERFRPLGDRWGNFGILASGADYDLKLVELITNMQDAVIERAALRRYGSRESAAAALESPQAAVKELLHPINDADIPEVQFWESDPPASKSHKLTVFFDDRGTGMTNASVPTTIFALGGSNKEDAPYLQGAFGLGGELMYRNSDYVILVTRRDPSLLTNQEEDLITVAVVQWNAQTKTQTAAYLVDSDWERPGDEASPWSCPASEYPAFEPGTHIALISYGTAGLYRKREGDSRSFDTIVNTRLFRPMFPTRWRNFLARGDSRATTLRGLRTRLDSTTHDFPVEDGELPFVYRGKQYFLEISYVVFAEANERGNRRSFVAHDHAVLFTSNGQVQTHWTPSDFKQKTNLKKLDGRILVEVNLDSLPVEARTALVTPDRAGTVKSDIAAKLDDSVVSFLNDWDSLLDENRKVLNEQLRRTTSTSTRGVTDQIRRAFAARGFGLGGGNGGGQGGSGGDRFSGGSGARRKSRPPLTLLTDPTKIDGPATLRLEVGQTRGQHFTVNAIDDFFRQQRGELQIEAGAEFPFESVSEVVAIGQPHNGYVRLSFAIPDGFEGISFDLKLSLRGWSRSSGGVGKDLEHTFSVSLVNELPGRGTGAGSKATGSRGGNDDGRGGHAVLLWSNEAGRGWKPTHVGEIERIPASSIASLHSDYADLASLGDSEVDCITLNSEYQPLVNYLNARAEAISSLEQLRGRFAVGVAVQMLVLAEEEAKFRGIQGPVLDERARQAAYRAAARGVLAVLPEFDRLAQLADVDI